MSELTTTNTTNGVNGAGASASSIASSAIKSYTIRSTAPLEPGEVTPIPYRLQRAARVVDLVTPDGVALVRAVLGRRRIVLEGDEADATSIAEALAREPYEGNAGTFFVLNVRSATRQSHPVEIALRVTGEHGEEADNSTSPFRMGSDGNALGGSSHGADRPGRSGSRSPRSPMAPADMAPARKSSAARRPPPLPSAVAKRAKGVVRVREGRGAASAVTPVTPSVVVQPLEGERALVTFCTYAEALANFFERGVGLQPGHRTALVHQLRLATEREGASVSVVPGEVAIILQASDALRLHDALQLRRERQLEDVLPIAEAVKLALAPAAAPSSASAKPAAPSPALITSKTSQAAPGPEDDRRPQ